jgi:DmsE family decaheme c-type cytochrome
MIRKLLAACALIGAASALWAADANLPDTSLGGQSAQTQQALKKDALCTRCHDESEAKPVLSIYQTRHGVKADARTPSCQSCHGESEKHLKGDPKVKGRASPDIIFKKGTYSASEASTQSAACLTCHKTGLRQHWSGSQHESRDIPCASCHTVHAPRDPVLSKSTQKEVCFTCHKDQRAQTHRISTHPLDAGKMSCSDCHNPHGSTGPKLLLKNSVSETCYTCHAEKRGPFLWEHGPVIDDCTNCHTPHGSNNTPLLKTRVPFLCQECHTGDHGSGINSGANLPNGAVTTVNGLLPLGAQNPRAQTDARACLNCHVLVHGSNSPAGAKFQR